MLLPGRHGSVDSYRYGFQGQEKDDEIKGEANSINYKFRMHDPRIGRFFAVDPLASKYPWYSPYSFSGNRVIDANELEGMEPKWFMELLKEDYPNVIKGLDIAKKVKGNNFSLNKLLTWGTGESSYIDGYRKLKGLVGESIIYSQEKLNHEAFDVRWKPDNSTADIIIEGDAGYNIWSRRYQIFNYSHNDLNNNVKREEIIDGEFALLIEVKTLDVNDKNFNIENLASNVNAGFEQVLKQMENYKKNENIDNVIGVLVVDQEVIDKILSSDIGVTKQIFEENYNDFIKDGGRLHTVKGSKKDKTNLNGKADAIVKKLYSDIKNNEDN